MLKLAIAGSICVILAVIGLSLAKDFYFYGISAFWPKIGLKDATYESLEKVVQPGITTKDDLYQLFGKPAFESGRIQMDDLVDSDDQPKNDQTFMTWKVDNGFYFVITMNAASKALTVFLDENEKVVKFEFNTNY